ncbi:metalloregulator ArsR/SmtB family transcription factor [uncultured Thermanaerothrix sp.]|uniref:ArsR/SmtB family transcription factor n=1 Tax=uncultured Thermanaerothrix sp. TaxID=1195149 RepID=UPI00262BE1D8|nr:metalloregulator ArsR/SmtB family transcription factor [uncultured Thermanaerothrix sp.]
MLNIDNTDKGTTFTDQFDSAADFFRALAHPVRLALLELLRDDEACVCHLQAVLGLRQAYISQQLMFLRQSGLVSARRQGWNVYYRVNDPRIFEVIDRVKELLPTPQQLSLIPEAVNCTCPRCRVTSRPA